MAVSKDKAAPYAPGRTVMDVIDRYRDKGLPTPINNEVLARAGVSDSLLARTLQALTVLDLIDEKGMPTVALEKLRLAPEAEYKQHLQEWLNVAYADVLAFVDPATSTETQIRDAFRPYKPPGQQDRMVTLFCTLYAAAGLRTEKEAKPQQQKQPGLSKPKPTPSQHSRPNPVITKRRGGVPPSDFGGLHPMLAALLNDLPQPGQGWTREKRNKVVDMFPTVLDFAFPIVEERDEEGADEE